MGTPAVLNIQCMRRGSYHHSGVLCLKSSRGSSGLKEIWCRTKVSLMISGVATACCPIRRFSQAPQMAIFKHSRARLKKSGQEIHCDLLVAATGYKAGQSFLPEEIKCLKEEDGLWLYQNMVHPDFSNLIFLNSNTTTFTNITTASIQARWLAELLHGRFSLPTQVEMKQEIEKVQEWKRSTMPDAGASRE